VKRREGRGEMRDKGERRGSTMEWKNMRGAAVGCVWGFDPAFSQGEGGKTERASERAGGRVHERGGRRVHEGAGREGG